jgi:hypothetical protein
LGSVINQPKPPHSSELHTPAIRYVFSAKAVTVLIPFGATGYGTVPSTYTGSDAVQNWGNAFRGIGWYRTNYDENGTINGTISLTIDYTTP